MTRSINRFRWFIPFILLLWLLESVQVWGSGAAGWVTRNENDYYLTRSGKTVTGRRIIRGKTYCFTRDGKQYHGWKKIGENYYCFAQGRKKKGFLILTGRPNGFRIDKKGRAVLNSEGEKKRMQAMTYVSSLLVSRTESSWSRRKKLKAVFNYARELPYVYGEQELTAAGCVLKFKKQVDGDCADTNSLMAFAGAVLGWNPYVVNDFGHWWAVIEGKIYDTNFNSFGLNHAKAAEKGFPYIPKQAISPDSPAAGKLMMTIHPDHYGYDVNNLTVYDRIDVLNRFDGWVMKFHIGKNLNDCA